MDEVLKKYKNYLLINGKSLSTINNYLPKIELFLKNTKVDDINEDNIIDFLLKIKEKNKASTVNIYRSAILSFNKFTKKSIPVPNQLKPRKKIPEYFTEEYFKSEIIPVIQSIYYKPLKMQAILYLLFYTGIRIGEINNIKRKHIDFKNREVKIYVEKRNEERIVIINKETKEIFKSYFATEAEEQNAFNITAKGIKSYFHSLKRYFKDINLHAHLFRHSFARMMKMKGLALDDLREAMGHKNINSTMIYTTFKTKDRKEIYDKIMKKKIK